MVSARFCEIYFTLQVLLYTFKARVEVEAIGVVSVYILYRIRQSRN